jgi:hypothetical protein
MDLDAILSGNIPAEPPPPAPPPEPPAPPQDAPPAERQFPPGENPPADAPGEPPAPPAGEQDSERIPIAALRDERAKRQAAEKAAADYRQRVEQYEQMIRQQQAAQQQPQRPDLFQDPDGALNHVQSALRQEILRNKVETSVMVVRQQHTDYDDAEAAFLQACQGNEPLYRQMLNHPFPAQFAYSVGQQMRAMAEIGNDPSGYRDRVRQEERDRLRKEWDAEQGQRQAQVRASVPPTLASARDTSGRFAPAWSGPPALKDILAPGRR